MRTPFGHLGSRVLLILTIAPVLHAEQGKLVLHVSDPAGHPIANLSIATSGDGGGPQGTDPAGKARVSLAKDTKANAWVTLQIVKSPANHDFVMVSPWNGRTQIPSFENESDNYVEIVVAELGDKALLQNGKTLAALAAKINNANAPKTVAERTSSTSSQEKLAAILKQYGLSPDDVDRAIRAWGAKTSDPYDVGLAALYERDYPEATKHFSISLRTREKVLKDAENGVVDAASFLGQSLYAEGRYSESAAASKRALQLRPEDAALLNLEGLSLYQGSNYVQAEPLYRRALAIDEKTLGPEHPDTAASLNHLAELLKAKGDYAGAEPLYHRSLAILEKTLGPEHPDTATSLNNLAGLLETKGDYAGAEPLLRRALAIREKALRPEHSYIATSLNNLARLLEDKGDYAGAEPLYRRALVILDKEPGPEHPDTATCLNNLARLLEAEGEYAGAEPLLQRALAIREKALGPEHPDTAVSLNSLARLL